MKESRTKNGNPVLYFGLTEGESYDLRNGGSTCDFVGKVKFRPKGAKEDVEMVIAVREKAMEGRNGKSMLLCKLVIMENKSERRFGR